MNKTFEILLIDDDETSNYISEIIIQMVNSSINISKLSDGQEAINHFSKVQDPPDLVLLDLNMPLINGFEFLEHYAKQNWNGRTKFAIYSSSSRESDKQLVQLYEHVIDYVEKPLTEEKLRSIINKVDSSFV